MCCDLCWGNLSDVRAPILATQEIGVLVFLSTCMNGGCLEDNSSALLITIWLKEAYVWCGPYPVDTTQL